MVINFMFGCRPATGAAMRAGDLFLAVGSFCLRLETEKQRSLEMERRVLRVPAEFIAGPLALWQRWVARREALAFPIAGRARVWGLTPSSPVRARDLDLWFRDAVAATSFVAPPGFEVTGYAARRGMATAAASINAHMEMIKYVAAGPSTPRPCTPTSTWACALARPLSCGFAGFSRTTWRLRLLSRTGWTPRARPRLQYTCPTPRRRRTDAFGFALWGGGTYPSVFVSFPFTVASRVWPRRRAESGMLGS